MPLYGWSNGVRVCAACENRQLRAMPNGKCRECGKSDYLVRGLCSRHYKRFQVAARPVGLCIDCREPKTRDSRGRCTRCAKKHSEGAALCARLVRLLGAPERMPAAAQQLYAHLTTQRSLHRIMRWLDAMATPVRAALRAIAKGVVPTWTSLQPLRRLGGGEQLFITCLRAGLVQAPLAETHRVEQLLEAMQAEGPAPAALMVKQYWRFYLAERVALRQTRKLVDRTLESDRAMLTIAFAFLRYVLLTRKHTIPSISNGDVTAWIRQARRSHVPRLKPFLHWLFDARLVRHRLDVPTEPISPGTGTPAPIYRAIQRRARADSTLPLLVRMALLLITKCARYPREIVQLRLSDLRHAGRDVVWIRFAHGMPQPLEGPDALLIKDLYTQRRRKGGSWLFPSKPRPEAHMTSQGICGLIHEAGITVNLNQLRNAAFRDALKDFTPMELCEILGMSAGVAQHWKRRGFNLTRSQKAYANKLSRTRRRKRMTVAETE